MGQEKMQNGIEIAVLKRNCSEGLVELLKKLNEGQITLYLSEDGMQHINPQFDAEKRRWSFCVTPSVSAPFNVFICVESLLRFASWLVLAICKSPVGNEDEEAFVKREAIRRIEKMRESKAAIDELLRELFEGGQRNDSQN